MNANGFRVSFWVEENVLKLIVVMAAQLCEYTCIKLYILFIYTYFKKYVYGMCMKFNKLLSKTFQVICMSE